MQAIWEGKTLHLGKPISFTKYKIDKERVYVRQGLLNIVEEQVPLYRVLDISLKQSFLDTIFKQGTLILHTSDLTEKAFIMKNIGNPSEVRDMLNEFIEKRRVDTRVRTGEITYVNDSNRDNIDDDPDYF